MNSFAEILLIAIFMSAACALPGNFLVLRRMSMLTDAISHTVLLGIVLAFLAVGSLDSPFLIIGASQCGLSNSSTRAGSSPPIPLSASYFRCSSVSPSSS